jgi:NADH-quinone oxidoreductase subunit C
MEQEHPTIPLLKEKFGPDHFQVEKRLDGLTQATIPTSILLEVMQFLHDDPQCDYEQLTDVFGIDYQGYPRRMSTRFALVYTLLSLRHNRRLVLKVFLEEPSLTAPTMTGIYNSALWPEREAAEMFGLTFQGHPDPRRLLLCDLFEGKHPLRKDYPLKGMGERESFKVVDREMA